MVNKQKIFLREGVGREMMKTGEVTIEDKETGRKKRSQNFSVET